MNKARETRERYKDKFHNSMSSLGFEPPNHGVVVYYCGAGPYVNYRQNIVIIMCGRPRRSVMKVEDEEKTDIIW